MAASGHGTCVLVLAGGRSTRLGEDKTRAMVAGRPLIDHLLGSLSDDVDCIVVGPSVQPIRPVRSAREDEPFGGPVAGIAAGLPLVAADVLGVCAADMPFAGALVERLVGELSATEGVDAMIPVDPGGRRQYLAAAYRSEPLRQAIARVAPARGRSMRELVSTLCVREVRTLDPSVLLDVDTREGLATVRAMVRAAEGVGDG